MSNFILANAGLIGPIVGFLIGTVGFGILLTRKVIKDTVAIAIVNAVDPALPELERLAKATKTPWDDLLLLYVVNPAMERLRKAGLASMTSGAMRLHALKVARKSVPAHVAESVSKARFSDGLIPGRLIPSPEQRRTEQVDAAINGKPY